MRYVLNLATPLVYTCIGLLIMAVMSSLSGKGGILQGVGEMAKAAFPFVVAATFVPVAWGCYRYYRVLRWEHGERDGNCRNCGGDTSQRTGRYGAYVKCRMCGNKREGWQ